MTLTLYGIATCDSCRKARKWLDDEGIDHVWVDIRTSPDGLPAAALARALAEIELKRLVNKIFEKPGAISMMRKNLRSHTLSPRVIPPRWRRHLQPIPRCSSVR